MKNSLFIGSALGVFLLAGAANAATVTYKATLTGTQENPAVTTDATGTAELTFDTETKKLFGTITYSGLSGDATNAHIHKAACGANGDVIANYGTGAEIASPIETDADGSEALEDADVTALEAGNLYINIHTAAHAGGEIRGQILKADDTTTKCPAGSGDGDGGGGGNGDGGGTSSGSSGTSSSGTSGTGTSSGTSGVTATSTDDDSGCSTTGSSAPGSGLALALGVGLAMAAVARGRRNKK